MEIVRSLKDGAASKKLAFTLTDEEAQKVANKLDAVSTSRQAGEPWPFYLSFRDEKNILRYYPTEVILFVGFESNWIPPKAQDEQGE